MQPSTIASWGVLIWRALEARGLDARAVFRRAGLDPAAFDDPGARYPVSGLTRAWNLAVEASGDPCFGLEAAQFTHPTTFHALGYAWLASRSLRAALARFVRYTRLVSTGVTLRTVEVGDELEFLWLPAVATVATAIAAADAGLAAAVTLCRTSAGPDFRPKRVRLRRERPECAARFDEFFRAPVEFGADDIALVFDSRDLDRALPTANAELARASEQVILDYLTHLDRAEVATQVKAGLTEMLPSGRVTAQAAAEALHLSVRSLQRKLAAQGTSFAAVLEETRRELATQYVRNSRRPVGEIAYLLGFSEPANFTRAFRRWTGRSPSDFRAQPPPAASTRQP